MKETKFKVGDKVRIRTDLNDSMPFGVNSEMRALKGKEVVITSVCETIRSDTTARYEFNDDGGWSWSDQMLELIEIDVHSLFKAGGMVRFRAEDAWCPQLHKIVPKADGSLTFTTENGNGWVDASDYDKNGNHKGGSVPKNTKLDLIEIYAPSTTSRSAGKFNTTDKELLWERKEIKELTLEEVAKLAGCEVSQLKIKK